MCCGASTFFLSVPYPFSLLTVEELTAVNSQLKYTRNQSKRPSVKTGFLGLSGKSTDAINFYTSKIERPSKEMLVDDIGDVTITNDGAIILKMLDVEHLAAKVEE
ncbi:CSC1-like protein [Camellia lanceoleosa]|uniref:CSC1-like protein n=1 Tax=Camellia lanceoleosa TaxID=1840588 RepID=A0ACC0GST1_9ERIC|nr:CSC1-like protein [Camellia lanceoleosa]